MAITSGLLIVAWYFNGGLLNAIGAVVFALLFLAIVGVLVNSKTPLEIDGDSVVISSLFRSRVPLTKIEKIGQHSTKQTPCLIYKDPETQTAGEMRLPWTFIAEPEAEVLAKLQAAIDRSRRDAQV